MTEATWAMFEYAESVHAMPGRYSSHVPVEWPADHTPTAVCPCRPELIADPQWVKPVYRHERRVILTDWPPRKAADA